MMQDGYEIYVVEDASGGTSDVAQRASMDRMVQAGVVPVTWQQVLLELQRDWARKDTYDQTIAVVQEHSGGYGRSSKRNLLDSLPYSSLRQHYRFQ